MNGAASTVPAAMDALHAMLQAHPLLADVQILDDEPGDTLENEGIGIGDTAEGQHQYPVLRSGKKPREETYTFPVEVWSLQPGEPAKKAKARVFELLAVLEDVVATDPTLNGTVRTAGVGSFLLATGVSDGKGAALINVDIQVSARLAGALPGGNP